MSGGNLGTQIDRPHAQRPETRAAAVRVVSGYDQAELLLMMLGLVPDPVADERNRAKAKADMRAGTVRGAR